MEHIMEFEAKFSNNLNTFDNSGHKSRVDIVPNKILKIIVILKYKKRSCNKND